MADFTIENVCQAIQLFSKGDVEYSDEFLRKFAQSNQAWTICIQILQSNPDNANVFHLLRILKSKVLYDFISLTPEEVTNVFTNSLQFIIHYGRSTQKSIRIQCVLIFIYLYIYTYYQQTKTILEFLTTNMDCLKEGNSLTRFLYDTIETLPEELIDNKNLVMDDKKLKEITMDIKQKQMYQIIEFLQNKWVQEKDMTVKFHILRSYKKWLNFMKDTIIESEAIQFLQLSSKCPLFQGALISIQSEELQDKAVEAICTFISLIPKSISESNVIEPNIIAPILSEVFKSFTFCEKALVDDLPDEIYAFVKLYVKVGKKFIHQILLNQQLEPFINTMTAIFIHPNSESECEAMSDFWIKLIKTIRLMNDQSISSRLQGTFEILIKGCVDRSKVDETLLQQYMTGEDIEDEFEQKLKNRSQMKDIIEELATIIQPNLIINQIGQILKSQFISNMNVEGWIVFEACMNIMNGIIKQILLKNDQIGIQYLIEIINLYLNVINTNQMASNAFIMKSIFKTISEGCAQLLTSPDILPKLFNFINIGINHQISSVQKRATKAFQKICTMNQQFVLSNLNQFLELIVKMQNVSNYDNLLKGVANAVCSTKQTMQDNYVNLCSIYAKNLSQLKSEFEQAILNTNVPTSKQQIDKIIEQISKNLSSLVYIISQAPQNDTEEFANIRSLICGVYIELWPLLQYFIENLSKLQSEITEKIVRYTKHTFRATFNTFSVELLTRVFHCLLSTYQTEAISSCIYAAEVAATVFYKYTEYRQVLSEAFENMCTITFQHLPKLQSFEDHPDLTEDFFGMLVRYGRYTPSLLMQSSALPTILELTMAAIGIEHVAAGKSFYAWLEVAFKILKPSDEVFRTPIPMELKEVFQQHISRYIPQYLYKLFDALRKGPSDKEVEDYIVDCINAIAELSFVNFKQLLLQALEDGPSNLLTKSEKLQWIEQCGDQEKQSEFLELYTRRSYQSLLRG